MYKEILEALKTKFNGVNETILGRVAKKLAETATTAEEVTTAVEGVTFQQLLDSNGDARATDAVKTAILNYERKHNIKDGKPILKDEPEPQKTEPNPTDNGDQMPSWAKAILEGQKQLDEAPRGGPQHIQP